MGTKKPGVESGPFSKIESAMESDDSSLFQRHEGTILIDGLQRAAAQLDLDELTKLRNPNALGLEIWGDRALHDLGDVTTDTALFLGQS